MSFRHSSWALLENPLLRFAGGSYPIMLTFPFGFIGQRLAFLICEAESGISESVPEDLRIVDGSGSLAMHSGSKPFRALESNVSLQGNQTQECRLKRD